MLEFGSVVPERENLPYYIVSMAWFHRWQKYTGCIKVDVGDDDDGMEIDQVNKNGISNSDVILGEHPGRINSDREIRDLTRVTERKVFTNELDFYGMFYLKDSKKEDEDFKVVDEQVWNILYPKYGGNEMRRKSITVPTENPERPDYIVEVQLRRFKILTWPKVKYFPQSLSLEVYCSRTDTVKELISKICQSEEANDVAHRTSDEMIQYCRLWKMEGDDVAVSRPRLVQ